VRYKPLGQGKSRAVILDECHRVSKQAFDSILKTIEEPPAHLFWFLCTTDPQKVPETITSRCQHIRLEDAKPNDLIAMMQEICGKEGWATSQEVLTVIASQSLGSPRRALVHLAACYQATNRKEALAIIAQILNEDAVIALCRYITTTQKRNWAGAVDITKKMGVNTDYESVRVMVARYLGRCLKTSKSDEEAAVFLNMLQHWSTPYYASDGEASLMLSLGQTLLET